MNDDTTVRTDSTELAFQALPPNTDLSATDALHPADLPDVDVARVAGTVGLTLIGGLAVGLVVGALLPGSKRRRKISKKTKSLGAIAAEIGELLLAEAGDAASKGSAKASQAAAAASATVAAHAPDLDKLDLDKQVEELSKQAQEVGKQAQQVASAAADQLNDATKAIARQAIKWIEKVRG